jgi:predicted nucleotidyltransferase
MSKLLTRDDILAAWTRLGELASSEGGFIDLLVVGGAVMAVYFRSRDATEDVDGIFAPAPQTRAWAAIVAEENGWDHDWLNDGAKGYVAKESFGPLLHESPGIRVRSVSIAHLLAMKLMAWRDDVDFNDAVHLLRALEKDLGDGPSDQQKILNLLEEFFIDAHRLKAKYAFEELWELSHGDEVGENRS